MVHTWSVHGPDQTFTFFKSRLSISPSHVAMYSNRAGSFCKWNKTGYCKFGDECKLDHEEEICSLMTCDGSTCRKRHPKACRYFLQDIICPYGEFCRYLHDKGNKSDQMNIRDEFSRLHEAINQKNQLVEELSKKIEDLKQILKTFMNESKPSVEQSKTKDPWKCDDCELTFKGKRGLQVHMKTHSFIHQIDGNVTIGEEDCACG